MILNKVIVFIFFLIFNSPKKLSANNHNEIDIVAEVIAKEVFTKMRIKFDKGSLKIVTDELKAKKVPQRFLKYFSCKKDLKSYKEAKACLSNRPNKSEFESYTTSVSDAITNLYQKGIVLFSF